MKQLLNKTVKITRNKDNSILIGKVVDTNNSNIIYIENWEDIFCINLDIVTIEILQNTPIEKLKKGDKIYINGTHRAFSCIFLDYEIKNYHTTIIHKKIGRGNFCHNLYFLKGENANDIFLLD